MLVEELPPSKLGTKEYWDSIYDREVRVFDDIGDEGEIWFGEDSVHKMRQWAHENLPQSSSEDPLRIIECGSGNGTLLLSFLISPEPPAQQYRLTGIDYSEGAKVLAEGVEKQKRETLDDELEDEQVANHCTVEWRVGDLLRQNFDGETWNLVLDKGTYDALCLSDKPVQEDKTQRLPSEVYPERITKLISPGGFFLITSCNFTEEEIKERFNQPQFGLSFHIPHPTYSFGGKTGSIVCTVAFEKALQAS
ncbi:uncharacterized protein L203_104426 [Cryptococcus depauperatus CBS 7841]|uniref:Protein-lysine N-methyltransferase EFM4 n=1 Tax=Cryptococcus depauperatus CBS 7841 TaxID=1295531 RepID=A0AAJ8JVG5_9TREE